MTPEDAIALNKATAEDLALHGLPCFAEAVRLGIEALKTIKAERTIYGFKRQVRLPGETEEENETREQ